MICHGGCTHRKMMSSFSHDSASGLPPTFPYLIMRFMQTYLIYYSRAHHMQIAKCMTRSSIFLNAQCTTAANQRGNVPTFELFQPITKLP